MSRHSFRIDLPPPNSRKTFSSKWQYAKPIVKTLHVIGLRKQIMKGELKPTYIPSWRWEPNLERWAGVMGI